MTDAYVLAGVTDHAATNTPVSRNTLSESKSAVAAQVGDFGELEELGRGGMGVVYRARDLRLNRLVALKVLGPGMAEHAEARSRFLREGEAAAAIRHDNVVAVLAALELDNQPVLVLEYVAGAPLSHRLAGGQTLPVREILRIGAEAAAGLAAAHARGIIHRDVKPGNILLEEGTGRVKLADFGLARIAGATALTEVGTLVGTPWYMSPEQALSEPVDHRADLFSLGCVLYHAACGCPPYAADNPMGALWQVCHAKSRPLRKVNPELPAWFTSVVEKLMAPAPADRYASAAEVEKVLRDLLRDTETMEPRRPKPRPARNWLFALAAGVCAILFTVTAGYRPEQQPVESSAPMPLAVTPLLVVPQPPVHETRKRQGVLLIITQKDFYHPELNMLRGQLIGGKVPFKIAAESRSPAISSGGEKAMPDLALSEVKANDFDVLVFVGGVGIHAYTGKSAAADQVRRLLAEAVAAQPPVCLAANSSGPVILARAGYLRGIRATCYRFGEPTGVYVNELKACGAVYVDEDVVDSGNVITGGTLNVEPMKRYAAAISARVRR